MSVTPQEARKQVFAMLDRCWREKSEPIAGYIPEIRYYGDQHQSKPKPPTDKYWAMARTNNVRTMQTGFTNPQESKGSSVVYTTYGFIIVQLFAPMTSPESYAKGELLSGALQAMFMATETPGSVWFRRPRINELDHDGVFYRWNVTADFEFNQVKGN